jgi:hypothetical protein
MPYGRLRSEWRVSPIYFWVRMFLLKEAGLLGGLIHHPLVYGRRHGGGLLGIDKGKPPSYNRAYAPRPSAISLA